MAQSGFAASAREKMVESQVRPNEVNDRRIIGAMRALPREAFCPPGALAYSDADIPLGGGRFMPCPLLAARLAQLVLAGNPEHVLVVASGAGYIAAVLAASGVQVTALEEDAALDTGALARHAPNVLAVRGKLAAGWPANGPYDAILIEGAVKKIPEIFLAQLTASGRVVTVLAEGATQDFLGRAVVAEPSGEGFAMARMFDCTARLLPAFQSAPQFTF